MSSHPHKLLAYGVTVAGILLLAACQSTVTSGDAIAVTSSNEACEIAATEAPSGVVTFTVTNAGDQVTEFYVLAEDGLRIVGEVENIGPGLTRDLVVQPLRETCSLHASPA